MYRFTLERKWASTQRGTRGSGVNVVVLAKNEAEAHAKAKELSDSIQAGYYWDYTTVSVEEVQETTPTPVTTYTYNVPPVTEPPYTVNATTVSFDTSKITGDGDPRAKGEFHINDVRVEGYPEDTDGVILYFDGCWVSGWPLSQNGTDGYALWEADSDVGHNQKFAGVRYWAVAPRPGE